MIVTLSPTKILDFKTPTNFLESTIPQYLKDAEYLYTLLLKYSPEKLSELMSVNTKLSEDVFYYIQNFQQEDTPTKQAVLAYNGIAYQGLNAENFTKENFNFAQQHLVILSGLYGILRPLDLIKPYRLEIQTNLPNKKGCNLYDFWKETISKHMAKLMLADDNIWINLTSKEYFKSVDKTLLPKGYKIISPIFKEDTGTGYKQIVVYTKKARGMMAKFIIENSLTDVEHIKGFDYDNYFYSAEFSNDNEWVFIR